WPRLEGAAAKGPAISQGVGDRLQHQGGEGGAASAMPAGQGRARARGGVLLALGGASALLAIHAQAPSAWVGASWPQPRAWAPSRGGGSRDGPMTRRAVEVNKIRSRIKEDQGKSWIEFNIGQMGHTANVTWAKFTEYDATDSWVQVDLGGCRAKYIHRVVAGDAWDSTAYTFDINKRMLAKEIIVNGALQTKENARPNSQITTSWGATLGPLGLEVADLPATLEPLLAAEGQTLEHWPAFKELWAHYV
ncbi:unnamed protein product, partial [Prorocentrum cordatum]